MGVMRITMLLLAGFLLISCGGGSDNTAPPPRPPGEVSGTAFDGLIRNGLVTVYSFSNGTVGEVLGTDTTNSIGHYTISITAPDQPILLEIRGGNYVEEATGKNVSLLDGVDFLRAVTHYTSGQAISTSITYYTTIATGLAEYLHSAGLPISDAINTANTRAGALAGVDIQLITPLDITDIDSRQPSLSDELRYGFATAAISELTKQQSLLAFPDDSVSLLHTRHNSIRFSQMAYKDIKHDGKLDGVSEGGTLSIGSVPVVTSMYRHDTAVSMLVIASNMRNQTNLSSDDLRTDAERMAANTDVMFGGVAPIALFTGSDNPQVLYSGSDFLTGIVSITPQIILSNGVALESATLSIGVTAYGAAVDISAPSWSIDTTALPEGPQDMVITATDAIARTGTLTQSLTVNNAEINVSVAPAANAHIYGSVELIVTPQTVTGLTITEVSVDILGAKTLFSDNLDGTWRYTLNSALYSEGLNLYSITAKDSGGRDVTVLHPLIVDNIAPVVTSDVSENWIRGTLPVTITITETNLVSANVSVAGIKIKDLVAGVDTISLATSLYFDGTHSFTVTAIDQAGNKTVHAKTLSIDNTAPTLFFSNPVTGSVIGGDVDVNIRVTELGSGVSLTDKPFLVDGVRFTDGGFVCDADIADNVPCLFSFATRHFTTGYHTITAQVYDKAGNIGEATIVNVYFDNEGPTFTGHVVVSYTKVEFLYTDFGGPSNGSVTVGPYQTIYPTYEASAERFCDNVIRARYFRATGTDNAGNSTVFPEKITKEVVYKSCTGK